MFARGIMGRVLKISDYINKKTRKKKKNEILNKLSKFLRKADGFFSLAEANRQRDDDNE